MHSLFAHQKCVRTKCKCICPSFRKMITLCPAKCRERPTDRIAPDYIYALLHSLFFKSRILRSSLSVSLSFNFFWPSRLLFTSDSCYKHIVSVCVYVVYIYIIYINLNLSITYSGLHVHHPLVYSRCIPVFLLASAPF